MQGSGYISLPVTLALMKRRVPVYYIIWRGDDDLSRCLRRKDQSIIDLNDVERIQEFSMGRMDLW